MPRRCALTVATFTLAICAASVAVAGPVYVWTDEHGVEHWSDRPPGPHEAVDGQPETVTPELRNRGVSRVQGERAPAPAKSPDESAKPGATESGPAEPADDEGAEPSETEEAPGEQDEAASDEGAADDGVEEAPKSRAERLAEIRQRRGEALRNRAQGRPVERPDEKKAASPAPQSPPADAAPKPGPHQYEGYAAEYQL